jgi:hypothetical protein
MIDSLDLTHLARHWRGALSHFRLHRHDEHLEALVEEAFRFTGMQLEVDLAHSSYWSNVPLMRRVSVLLYLVDRGVVERVSEGDQVRYLAHPLAERWVETRASLAEYLPQTLELLSSLRNREGSEFREAGRV